MEDGQPSAWTTNRVANLAPNRQTSTEGYRLADPRKWLELGRHGGVIWGVHQTIAYGPYLVRVALQAPLLHRCPCQSKHGLCKYVIALLYLHSQAKIEIAPPPDWVSEWLAVAPTLSPQNPPARLSKLDWPPVLRQAPWLSSSLEEKENIAKLFALEFLKHARLGPIKLRSRPEVLPQAAMRRLLTLLSWQGCQQQHETWLRDILEYLCPVTTARYGWDLFHAWLKPHYRTAERSDEWVFDSVILLANREVRGWLLPYLVHWEGGSNYPVLRMLAALARIGQPARPLLEATQQRSPQPALRKAAEASLALLEQQSI